MELKDRISESWKVYKRTHPIHPERIGLASRGHELSDCNGFFFDLEGYSAFQIAYSPKVLELTPITLGFRSTPRISIYTETGFFQSSNDVSPKELKEYCYFTLCKSKKKLQEVLRHAEMANARACDLTKIAEKGSDLQKIVDACRATIIFSSFCLNSYAPFECYEPLIRENEPELPLLEVREIVNSLLIPLKTDVFSAFLKGMIRLVDSYLYDSQDKFIRQIETFLDNEGLILCADCMKDNDIFRQQVINLVRRDARIFPDIVKIYSALEDIQFQERVNRGLYWKARQRLESYYSDNPEMRLTVENMLELNTYAMQYNDEARRRRARLFRLISRPDVRRLEEAIAKQIQEEDYAKIVLELFSST